MKNNQLTKLSVAIGLSVSTASALASPAPFNSARAFGMAGTGVAVAHPGSAPLDNPALMAGNHHDWSDDFGLILPSANARAADEEEVLDQIDDLQDAITQFEASTANFDPATDDPQPVRDGAADLRDRLTAFDRDTVRTNLGAGLSLAVPSKTIAVGFFADASLTATVRGELANDDRALLDAVANASTAADVDAALDAVTDNGELTLDSSGSVLASAIGEVGISFARQFTLSDGSTFQLGFSPKYMELRTYQYTETVSGFDDDNADADDNMTEDNGFNVDIGAAYRFGDDGQWNAGVVVRNMIPMELESANTADQYTLKVDPMVTAGIAHSGDYHVVTAELDLTKKEAFGFEDDTQWLAVGAEFDALRYAQLRVGVRHNLASNDDNDGIAEETQLTAGLGVNLMGVRFDLGALYSDADVGAALEFGTAF
ncbi:conjugal transfer protein TraF [Marinobacter salinisoli]|uniref:Conjugal transfer protein TraF n=1 Tax=Marinobacter salinisoli TaxID=2769486 RepID=A0ABX7MRN2_9GAMM|nr:conjugal transfer protein TraF [Marinobacter salinisoli]QSP94944.1 conjugal transfer protein TraF [Marinobacter salinisoli]